MRLHQWIAVPVLLLGLAPDASAQGAPSRLMASGFMGAAVGQSYDALTANSAALNFGGNIAYLWKSTIGVEVIGELTPSFIINNDFEHFGSKRPAVSSYMFNVMGALPIGSSGEFVPFISGGAGTMIMKADVLNTPNAAGIGPRTGSTQTRSAIDIGGGFTRFVHRNAGLRVDVRYYRASGEGTCLPACVLTKPTIGGSADNVTSSLLSGLAFVRFDVGATVGF